VLIPPLSEIRQRKCVLLSVRLFVNVSVDEISGGVRGNLALPPFYIIVFSGITSVCFCDFRRMHCLLLYKSIS
jgi:hypothetical protein